jgi:CubicO group peptidase (beta-lactamase class C family)
MKLVKKLLKYIILLVVLGLVYIGYNQYPRLNIIAGYSAKNMSSSIFVAGRDADFTDATDNNFSPINIADDKVDIDTKSVETSVYGLMKRKAIYREGLGSVLVIKGFDESKPFLKPRRVQHVYDTIMKFPYYGSDDQKDTIFSNIDYDGLGRVVNNAFDSIIKTRAVLVIYKDQIIAEQYAPSFNKNSKILGWSMTKSITSTLYGILQKQGKLNINQKPQIDAWKNDKRSEIKINDLLHMNSGLEWEENYEKISDVTKMLFLAEDMGEIQENKELTGEINNSWNYSSGTSNLLSKNLRNYFNSHQAYLDFWYSDLIDKIGMYSMLVEADLSGTYVGSSYSWATTRDWAKFGLLYLHKGNWNGEQLFDESWVDYITTPTNSSNGRYGGHFWLNAGGYYPDAPKDLYSANGFQGQRVFIIPSKDLVIVRMGLDTMDFNEFLLDVISSIN